MGFVKQIKSFYVYFRGNVLYVRLLKCIIIEHCIDNINFLTQSHK